ncbi:MAG: DUF308 domain-containing protein [Firmicutes bacterium]|nr:DUF308 domain-containing protein [Bacillota bacterium]
MQVTYSLKPFGLLLGITLMIIGVVFLAVPERVAEFIAIFIGAIISVIGLFRIVTVFAGRRYMFNRVLMLIFGALILAAGIYILFNPNITIVFVGFIIGIFAILMALDRFVTANRLRNEINVIPTVISGLIHLAFGIGMIYSSILIFSIIIVIAGIYLFVAGIMFTLSTFYFRDY